jgi:hypothetical protein
MHWFTSHQCITWLLCTPHCTAAHPATTAPLIPGPLTAPQNEFKAEKDGYRATTHQRFVGTGYFDEIAQKVAGGLASTCALTGSTEEHQF